MILSIALAAALAAEQPELRDAESVTRLLASLRTADPAVCELAARTLTNGWGWANGGEVVMPTPTPMPMPTPTPMPRAGGVSLAAPGIGMRGQRDVAPEVLGIFRTTLKDPNRCVRSLAARIVARARPAWARPATGRSRPNEGPWRLPLRRRRL